MAGTCSLRVTVAYTAPVANAPRSMAIAASRGYAPLMGGDIVIPVGFSGAFEIPVGLMDNVDGFIIRNNTNQDLGVDLNDNGEAFSLPPGGEIFQLNGTTQATIPLTEIALATTETQTSGNNTVSFMTLQRAA